MDCHCGGSIWIRKLEIVNIESIFNNTGKTVLIDSLLVWKKANEAYIKVTRQWIFYHFSQVLVLTIGVSWHMGQGYCIFFKGETNIKRIPYKLLLMNQFKNMTIFTILAIVGNLSGAVALILEIINNVENILLFYK